MFTIYHSNQVDVLKAILVEIIRRDPLDNPLQAEQILVQSPGMSQWLKMEIAHSLGIAANIEFPLPATFIWRMFTQVLEDVPQRSAFNKEAITWKLMHLIPQHIEDEAFAPLRHYLLDEKILGNLDEQNEVTGEESSNIDQNKTFQLAQKIADIFDAYLVYRPEWIEAWEKGQEVAELIDAPKWQEKLWQCLVKHTQALAQSHYHRANLYQSFIDALKQGKLKANLPKRLFVFGITSLPPKYLEALHALGEHIDVHLMLNNPCRYYWGDVQDRAYLERLANKTRLKQMQILPSGEVSSAEPSPQPLFKADIESHLLEDEAQIQAKVGNSLLASLGKQGRDNLYLLSQLEANDIDAFVDSTPKQLLAHIQRDILELSEPRALESGLIAIDDKDQSLQLHLCHSAVREVEVLHDRLLAMFDADPELKPRDIIVMVADINAYSHAIQAVFGSAAREHFIPYSISDRSLTQENPILQAFLTLLALPQTRYQSSDLLDVLQVPAIMQAFDFSDSDHEKLTLWIEQTGIRWGLDDDTARGESLPVTHSHTWQFGMERMLTGYAMPEVAGLFQVSNQTIAVFDEIQGDNALLAGKLSQFIERLDHYRHKLGKSQCIEDWQQHIMAMLDDFFVVDEAGEAILHTIRQCVSELKQQLSDAMMQSPLTPELITHYLQDTLANSRVSQRFLAGQVNFCTLMPMRSIPFKVVCLLGMNDGVYPRSLLPEPMDLMQTRLRAGDRSRREDDRYLFLEALLAAQQTLYISYIGQSIQDNSHKEPSVLVAELLDYIKQNYYAACAQNTSQAEPPSIIHSHPLVPYSPSCFDGQDPHQQSYAKTWLAAAKMISQGQIATEQALPSALLSPYWQEEYARDGIELNALKRFWRLPVAYFFNHRLNTYFDEVQVDLSHLNDEPFALDALDRFQVNNELLERFLRAPVEAEEVPHLLFNRIAKQYFTELKAQGQLPLGAFADIWAEQVVDSVSPFVAVLNEYRSQVAKDLEVNVILPVQLPNHTHNYRLNAWLNGIYGDKRIRYVVGQLHGRRLLEQWIEHLAMNASGVEYASHIYGTQKNQDIDHCHFKPMPAEQAQALLSSLLNWYFIGLTYPLPFSCDMAITYVDDRLKMQAKAIEEKRIIGDEDETEFVEQTHKKMVALFEGNSYKVGERGNVYMARAWKQWTPEMTKQLMEVAMQVLRPMKDNMNAGEGE